MTTKPAATAKNLPLDEECIRDILRQVIDPEVGKDIVALGLIYRIDLTASGPVIEMTMTSPACPMGELILAEVHAALANALPETIQCYVHLVWEPPWSPSMMDEATRSEFGWQPD